MNWRYYFAHEWTDDRSCWEDVYLLPDEPSGQGDSYCVTVDALGPASQDRYSDEESAAARVKLRDRPYHIEGRRMFVRGDGYSKDELLGWVRVWLEEAGFAVRQLVQGRREDFRGTNWHSRAVDRAEERSREVDRD